MQKCETFASVRGFIAFNGSNVHLMHFACKQHMTSSFSNSKWVRVQPLYGVPPAGAHDYMQSPVYTNDSYDSRYHIRQAIIMRLTRRIVKTLQLASKHILWMKPQGKNAMTVKRALRRKEWNCSDVTRKTLTSKHDGLMALAVLRQALNIARLVTIINWLLAVRPCFHVGKKVLSFRFSFTDDVTVDSNAASS